MITSGDNRVFAIRAEITATQEDWIFGHFGFVFHSKLCGDWLDEADLKACHSWLRDFVENPRQRFERELIDISPTLVFERLVNPILNHENPGTIPEYYPNTFSRFHISHIGMSAFDRFVLVLIEGPDRQRCIWREMDDGPLHDDFFPSGHMQKIASDFCRELEREISAIRQIG